VLGCAVLLACGREDIELSRPRAPAELDDCSAAVPPELPAPRPPLGWNGYNVFGCSRELNEAKLRSTVEALAASGMQAAGYQYVNLDQCWELPRGAAGTRVFDPERLPSGIEALAADLHGRGLSLGVFAPVRDCLGGPGGDGFESIDAQSYARWGVDYLKYVACPGRQTERDAVERIAQALRGSGRPITLSLASPPFAEWMPEVAQLWRTSGNSSPTFDSIVESVEATMPLAAYARPGAFNDPDMLEVGNGSLTEGEQRVQFSVWSILAAPLLAGNDLTHMTDATRAILTNSEVIALDQDPLGLQGALVLRQGNVDVLAKPLASCGARGVVAWNRGTTSEEVVLRTSDLWLAEGPASVRDLFARSELRAGADGITFEVPAHDAVALRVVGEEPPLPRGEAFLSDLGWTYAVNGYGPVELDTSNGEDEPGDGRGMRLAGAAYDKGLGVHPPSLIRYRLGRACSRFAADIGIDDEVGDRGSARFEVWADGVKLFESGTMRGGSPPRRIDLDVSGRRELRLFVGVEADSYALDHSDWANARVTCESP
jgi:alpha-galactosidase